MNQFFTDLSNHLTTINFVTKEQCSAYEKLDASNKQLNETKLAESLKFEEQQKMSMFIIWRVKTVPSGCLKFCVGTLLCNCGATKYL